MRVRLTGFGRFACDLLLFGSNRRVHKASRVIRVSRVRVSRVSRVSRYLE